MILTPNWVVPACIQSAYTTREGGVSQGKYDSFNLAMHVGDTPQKVAQNRAILKDTLALKHAPAWLNQVHKADILNLDTPHPSNLDYDASVSSTPDTVCAVMTADCLPLLLCDKKGTIVAAVHCGWRSIAAGIIEKTLALLHAQTRAPLIAWLGPAIGPQAFEVGEDMRAHFNSAIFNTLHFIPLLNKPFTPTRYLANIYAIARTILQTQGVAPCHIYETAQCTYFTPHLYYSFRREGVTGRMASLIWINAS